MSNLQERESRRKASIVGSMIEKQAERATGSGSRGRPKEEGRELKKRISLSVLPSLYEDIQKIAYVQRRSVSELIGELLEGYRAEHEAEIQGYGDLKKEYKIKLATAGCQKVNRVRFTFISYWDRFGDVNNDLR